ncbi:immunoglobulin domain-containing protein [Collinsella sp. AF08-23]|uniref:immunoglobulin domain-containing protein n=1 Tax=Collinsella sp. AF08-23 TaxID=2292211 RepID=UPI0013141C96|nr:immunoglobulin domain-containing protein [Collinsella sp. AF08-23]
MKRSFLSLLCVLALCLGLLPATALAAAPGGQMIYVGNENVTRGGYWTTDNDGNVTAYTGEGTPADNFIHYDAGSNTLTLHNATIKEETPYDTSTLIVGAAIGVLNQNGNAELTITLEGTNTIKDVSTAIYVLAPSTGSANLTITGDGILNAISGSNPGIRVQSNTSNGALAITDAKVTASSSGYSDGVRIQCGDSSNASLTVNGGSLTATGSDTLFAGITMQFGSSSGSGTPTVTVSDNAIVRANGSAGGIASYSSSPIQYETGSDSTGGIVFDNGTGTVYGNVTLQEDLEIGEGESLTIGKGASLNTGSHEVIVDGGTLTGGDKITGTVKYAPTITTQPTSQTVTEGGTATFTVVTSGTEPLSYQWQQSTDSGQSWTDIVGATDATYTTEATTTSMNGYQYHCVVRNSAGSITSDAVSLTVKEHVHTWGNPVWSWTEDGKSATATFTCENDATHKETPEVTVTPAVKKPATCTETGVTAYTATVEFNGQTYTDTKEVADIPATGHRYENGKCIVCSEVDPAFTAMIIEGANGKWQKGSEDGLSFTSNAAFDDFQKVQVDGKDLDASKYTVKEGSTIVTLKPSYLETLPAGKHTLAIVSDTGTAETGFTVAAAEKQAADDKPANDKAASDSDKESLAKTGDDSMLPIAALSILAVTSIATGVFALRRSRI